ncbi:translocation/assembly module TamB domain-containing protein [Oculatella sp. LEGE 06141]|uniref:translocation/assembly module TamB domain-containing protein n=1 Tax=Oculatella sp. LEGE 06141 TaxID=1828648 RepID=UPI001882F0CE|nr:translocation/assembly module TamB domain-containing protein [Oculatella sp. LEGE 06141]MBE9177726.1 translocation/assembly module TamB domain-containing protein [Oculatella sp. LEGE 06141]
MTNSPNSGQEPEPVTSRRSRLGWRRAGFLLAGVVLVGGIGGAWWAWVFIHEQLAPLIEQNLRQTLNRPVDLGDLETINLNGLRFGPSELPPTETDADRATVETVAVGFNLLELLTTRTLRLDITLAEADLYVDQTPDGRWIITEIQQQESEGPIRTELNEIRVRNSRLVVAPHPNVRQATDATDPPLPAAERSLITLTDVNGAAVFRNRNQQISYDVSGRLVSSGQLQIQGETDLETRETILRVRSQDLLATDVNQLIPLPLDLTAGLLNTDLEVQFPPDDEPLDLFGTVQFQDATVVIENVPNLFSQGNGTLRFNEQQIFFQNVRALYGEIPLIAGGSLHTQNGYNLTARVPNATVAQLLNTFDLDTPVPVAGNLRADLDLAGAIDSPLLTGIATSIRTARVDRVDVENVRTRFTLTPQGLTFNEIAANPTVGGQVTGNGRIEFGDRGGVVFDIQGQNVPGDPIARLYGFNAEQINIGQVNANAQVFGPLGDFQTIVNWRAPEGTYPAQGEIVVAGGTTQFRNTVLQVAGGTVRGRGQIVDRRWQAVVDASQIQLARFSSDLRGLFGGSFQLSGSLDDVRPEAIQAQGNAQFSRGIGPIDRSLTANVRWLGDRVRVDQATATGFRADGFVLTQVEGEGAPAITGLDLNLALQDYDLNELSFPIPEAVLVAGQADFTGRLTGTPASPNLVGALQLEGLAVNTIAFEPVLSGDIRYSAQGLDLNVAGSRDQIQVALNAQNRPTSFLIQRDETIAIGEGDGERLAAELRNFPLAVLNIAPAEQFGVGSVRGTLNGNFNLNIADLSNPQVVGEVAIADPALGYIAGDSFTGQIRYINGVATLNNGELQQAGSRYLISGNFDSQAKQLQGQITAEPGRVEDILTALQIFELSDFGRGFRSPTYDPAIAVAPVGVGNPNTSLLNQLRRFSEIAVLRQQQIAQREEANFLPDLSSLEGIFTGQVDIAFAPQTGVELDFSLRGQDWVWEDYQVDQIVADGSLSNGVVTLLPLRFESDETLLTFSGQVGGEEQSGQLRAQNVPAEALVDLFDVPLDIAGDLNATATLSGSLGNPQVLGEITLTDATLSDTAVQGARSIFGYSDARLNFDGRVVVIEENQPLTVVGNIPYAFPFMTRQPDTDELSLDVDVANEGLGLINLLTNQVAWRGGEGAVNLQVRGTLSQPRANGIATFDGARFTSQALPEPITDVTGTVLFNTDRIVVESLQGQFSDGAVAAQGIIPIFLPLPATSPDRATPLTVALDGIDLNFKGLYNGGVEGQAIITGTALAPMIGGNILLSNGRIAIPDGSEAGTPGAGGAGIPAADEETPIQLDNLMLTLGNNLQVTREPLLSFVATGDLVVNGTLSDLRPDGVINLRSGQVNLFTSQFNLARRYPNTVTFDPDDGLDPFLDVQLVTSVLEVTRAPLFQQSASPFFSSEVADVSSAAEFGEVQTVRVEATVTGPASEIYDNLELSSSPSRSDTELIALLGGGFIDTLGRGDATLAIANLAGSALLSNVQNLIGNTLGLSEFRLFPTTIINDEERTSTFGLAAELGTDITDNISVSLLQVLTAEVPTQYNIRYRLTDEFLLRGATNLSGDSRAVLEFRTSF